MSELFMECEEEELEPWQQQQQIPEVTLVDDDDDEPIFMGELTNNQRNNKTPPVKGKLAGKPGLAPIAPLRGRPTRGSVKRTPPDVYMPGKGVKSAPVSTPAMTAITRPQPVMVNNQGFIVTPSDLSSMSTNRELITALGKQYPPGTTFTIFPAGQPQLLQPMSQASVLPGVVHRPQVQQINNNIVTLSNVQSPASYSTASQLAKPNQPTMMQPVQSFSAVSAPIKMETNRIDQTAAKRKFVTQQSESLVKRTKVDSAAISVVDLVEGGGTCPRCNMEFHQRDQLKYHMKICTATAEDPANSNKRIMLVSDFYYGRYEGDPQKQQTQKTNTTFKCQTCLKILKNNIRFMNHMKHHLELEKQNSESFESHTTCQHCYRQYSTPFQLQCHIESAHTAVESSTNCKICELAFESEQVLLEHMKDTHKPGEMPYGCMVCDFRSSLFSDVENHFRTMHENTKDLLCPFCLKIHRTTHTYMNHYMKHQRKGIHRCGKCRLNFLTYKERVDHKSQFHKTFRKPKALEGLPAGTKVTIRASYLGKPPGGPNPPPLDHYASPETKVVKPPAKFESSPTPKLVSTVAVLAKMVEKMKSKKTTEAKNDSSVKRKAKTNLVLKNLRVKGGAFTCIECHAQIGDFFSHYPVMVNCGACKYRTSCKESFANHMIRFHSSITKKDRKWKTDRRKSRTVFKSTLVCLNCDLITSVTNGDAMTKHLIEKPSHVCRVLQEKDVKGDDGRHPVLVEPTTEVLFMVASAAQPKAMDTAHVESVEAGGGDLPYEEVTFEGNEQVTFEGTDEVTFEGNDEVTFEGTDEITFEGTDEQVTFEGTDEALKQSSSVADRHSDPVEPILVEDDTEERQKPSELRCRSPSSTGGMLGVADPSEQSVGSSVGHHVAGEQDTTAPLEAPMPVLDSLSNHIVVLDDPVYDGDIPHVEPESSAYNNE